MMWMSSGPGGASRTQHAAASQAESKPALALPRHVAVIMDGNGRWAKQRMQPRAFGHHAGVRSARKIVKAAADAGVEVLTLFAFSQENWNRPEEEVSLLMSLFIKTLRREIKQLSEHGLRWKFIGDYTAFAPELRALMQETEAASRHFTGMTLMVAVGYSGQIDIAQAAQRAATDGVTVTPAAIQERLLTAGLPDVDLMVRTGGELRISNFLLWQSAYAELYFAPELWPDFRPEHMQAALDWFSGRQRRFGRVPDAST
jgi:undecaprenyl diphosphate synthase